MIFKHFSTEDFELILKMLWHSYNINQALCIPDDKTEKTYFSLREALVKSVRDVHSNYSKVADHFPKISTF